jgi:ribosomal protein L18
MLEVENEFVGFVGYRIELLSLFEEVVGNGSFDLHDRFQANKQHNDKIREKEREIEIYRQHNSELLEIAKLMASQPINIETNSTMEIQIMSGDRHIHTEGGNYIESNSGVYIQGNYIDMNQDLTQAATQIQDLIEQLKNRGMTDNVAQEQVAKDIANQAQKNSTVKDKLVKWGQSLGDATVSDVVKGAVKLAIRSAGIPLP